MVTAIVKAGITMGMVFAGFLMIIFGISLLPDVIDDYDRVQTLNQSDEELEKLFTESKEYAAFAERFPDYVAEFYRGSSNARFQMGALNPETGNSLMMEMHYHGHNGNYIEKDIRCERMIYDERGHYEFQDYERGVLVKLYIESTKCLD